MIQVGVGGVLDIEVVMADVVNSFIIDHKCTVRVLQRSVCGKDEVVSIG